MKKLVTTFAGIAFLLISCQDKKNTPLSATPIPENHNTLSDSAETPLQTLKDNYQRIHKITYWTKIDSIDLMESTDGGILKLFYNQGRIEKMSTYNFGESGKTYTEFYLLNQQLSFVYEKDFNYNMPYYVDEKMAKENNSTEFYDPKKTKIVETRYYFNNGKLFKKLITDAESEKEATTINRTEEKELLSEFEKYLQMDAIKK